MVPNCHQIPSPFRSRKARLQVTASTVASALRNDPMECESLSSHSGAATGGRRSIFALEALQFRSTRHGYRGCRKRDDSTTFRRVNGKNCEATNRRTCLGFFMFFQVFPFLNNPKLSRFFGRETTKSATPRTSNNMLARPYFHKWFFSLESTKLGDSPASWTTQFGQWFSHPA